TLRHESHHRRDGVTRAFFANTAHFSDLAMTGTDPAAPSPEEQSALEQAMVKQMVQPTDQAKGNQRRLFKRDTRYASAQPQQDDADIFQSVVSQQTLNVVLHQRIQTADERGDHAEYQKCNSPPQRRI